MIQSVGVTVLFCRHGSSSWRVPGQQGPRATWKNVGKRFWWKRNFFQRKKKKLIRFRSSNKSETKTTKLKLSWLQKWRRSYTQSQHKKNTFIYFSDLFQNFSKCFFSPIIGMFIDDLKRYRNGVGTGVQGHENESLSIKKCLKPPSLWNYWSE